MRREGAAEGKLQSDCHFTHRPEPSNSYPLQSSNFPPSNDRLLSDQFASHSSRSAGRHTAQPHHTGLRQMGIPSTTFLGQDVVEVTTPL